MISVKNLHNQAMEYSDEAFFARQNGEHEKAVELFRKAYVIERQAAEFVLQQTSSEPTRSILLRSAATLAMDCCELREAERLVAIALSGDPPNDIAEELRDLLEQIYFMRHLELRGITLKPEELQISITGETTGYGITQSDLFVERIENTEKLLLRTAERVLKKPYRDTGQALKKIRSQFRSFISVPRPASFAVTLRIGETSQQPLPFEGANLSEKVINEFIDCVDLVNKAEEKTLQSRISDKAYYRNFIGLARNIAPDGKNVNQVGYTTIQSGIKKQVAFTRKKQEIKPCHEIDSSDLEKQKQYIEIKGTFKFADSLHRKNKIMLLDKEGKSQTIIVPDGMMNDIVKPMWNTDVLVNAIKTDNKVVLEDITPLEEN